MFLSTRSRFLGIVATALVAVLALAACGDSASGKSNADLLKDAAANMKALKTYHLTADITSAGSPTKLDGDFDVANNSYKIDTTSGGVSATVIVIGGTDVYISQDGTTYQKLDSSMTGSVTAGFGSMTGMWDNFKPEDIDANKDQIKDGTPAIEQIDGVDTKHMTGDMQALSSLSTGAGGDATTTGTVDLWVGPDSKPYVRQVKINSSDTSGTVSWSKFDEAVSISAPPTP